MHLLLRRYWDQLEEESEKEAGGHEIEDVETQGVSVSGEFGTLREAVSMTCSSVNAPDLDTNHSMVC